jgi:uncharacterized membrane protein (DUF2068 family)
VQFSDVQPIAETRKRFFSAPKPHRDRANLEAEIQLRWLRHMKSADNRLVRVIAVFKLLKAILLIAVGMSALHLLHKDVASIAQHWVKMLGLDPGNRYVDRALQKAGDLTPNKIKSLGVVSFIYAGLFLTEGIGLWLVKRWAEWFSVIITTSLVPVEVYEIHRHPNPIKILVLILNIAVVGYLVYRIRSERS